MAVNARSSHHASLTSPGGMLEAARRYISCGISVLPVAPRSKFPDAEALRLSGNTNLLGQPSWLPFTRRLAREGELTAWFAAGSRNLGIVTGYGDLLVLDFDDMQAFAAWTSRHGPVAMQAPLQRTRNGVHVFLLWHDTFRTRLSTNNDFVLLDSPTVRVGQIKGASDYVVAWPSVHPTGDQYVWQAGRSPWETPPQRIESLEAIGIRQARESWNGYFAFLPRLVRQPGKNAPVVIRWLKNKSAKLLGVFSRYS